MHQTAHWPPVLPQTCARSFIKSMPSSPIHRDLLQHGRAQQQQQQTRNVCWRLDDASAGKRHFPQGPWDKQQRGGKQRDSQRVLAADSFFFVFRIANQRWRTSLLESNFFGFQYRIKFLTAKRSYSSQNTAGMKSNRAWLKDTCRTWRCGSCLSTGTRSGWRDITKIKKI